MKLRAVEWEFPEPERYELHEGPFHRFEISRREFVATLGMGLVLSVAVPTALGQRAERGGRGSGGPTLAQRLHLNTDGLVTVLTSKVEIGQGSRTQLTQAAAEELRLPLNRVRLIMGDTAGPDDGGTAGSRTTPATVPTVRRACAAARQLLLSTAANAFGVEASQLSVRDGAVDGLPAGKTFSYADFVSAENAQALQRSVSGNVPLADPAQWQVLGKPAARVNSVEMVTGAHRYPSDKERPGMLYGKVLRPPRFGAKLTKVELEPAQAMAGVTAVRDGDFVGFAAPNSWTAEQAHDAVAPTAQWQTTRQPSNDQLFAQLREKAAPRSRPDRKGAPEETIASASRALRASYQVAYIQHAPLEPRAAVAEWSGEQLTVWTGSQQPARVRQDLAEALRVPAEQVRVIVPDTGGGFGGKHSGEAAVEAARLARAAGKPVCLRWSREEEFTWAYFRPAGVIDLSGALDAQGALLAWVHTNFNSGASALAAPYSIPHTLFEFRSAEQPLRSGSYRALAATANTFARESFLDELAGLAGANPLDFRLRHLSNPRVQAVLTAAAERFDWRGAWARRASRPATGIGLACGTEKGSCVGCCVEIELQERAGTFRVVRLVEAFECGAIQNPPNLSAQVEGCIIQGLGGALTEEIQFRDGQILNGRFSRYRVPRFRDVPPIETILLDRPDLSSVGAGETPIIAIAPAIANALAQATQLRVRSLPIRHEKYRAA